MLKIPVGDALICVIEPGNIQRLQQGKPMTIDFPGRQFKKVLVCFTPDIEFVAQKISSLLGKSHIFTPEEVDAILKEAEARPEITR